MISRKLLLIGFVLGCLNILFYIFIYFTFPEGYESLKPNVNTQNNHIEYKSIEDIFHLVMYSLLLIAIPVKEYIKPSSDDLIESYKNTKNLYIGLILISIVSIILLYVIVFKHVYIKNQGSTFISGLFFIIMGNSFSIVPYGKKNILSNEYMNSDPIIWRKTIKLRSFIFVLLGLIFLTTTFFHTNIYYFLAMIVLFFLFFFLPFYYSKKLYETKNGTKISNLELGIDLIRNFLRYCKTHYVLSFVFLLSISFNFILIAYIYHTYGWLDKDDIRIMPIFTIVYFISFVLFYTLFSHLNVKIFNFNIMEVAYVIFILIIMYLNIRYINLSIQYSYEIFTLEYVTKIDPNIKFNF